MDRDPFRPPLDAAALRDGVAGPGLPWRQLDVVAETGSTNADLLARCAAGENIDGAVLIAEHQNAGRGRHGRNWSAPPRAQIALSVGVDAADVPPQAWGWLPLVTGIAVVDALAEASGIIAGGVDGPASPRGGSPRIVAGGVDGPASPRGGSPRIVAGLKWPNDVVAGDGKLAGILAEVAAPKPVIVVGIGLNVTMTAQEAPDPVATSLLLLGAPVTDRNLLAAGILRELAARVGQWRTAAGADPALVAEYQRYSLTLGSRVRATLPGDREVVGIASAVDELGRLRIDTGRQTVTISAGDIAHLRPVS